MIVGATLGFIVEGLFTVITGGVTWVIIGICPEGINCWVPVAVIETPLLPEIGITLFRFEIFCFIVGTLVEIGILAGLTTRDYFPTIDAVDPIGRELEPSKLLFELDVPQLLLGIFPSKLLKLAAIHNPFFSTNPALHPHPSYFH